MRLATWNVNSIRARLPGVLEWLVDADADVLCLQETKCADADFPHEAFAAAGYDVAHHGVDHWNGVAIASRVGLADVRRGFSGPQAPPYDECRMVSASCAGIEVTSLYVPNGRALDDPHYLYKLVWLERLRGELVRRRTVERPALVAGDFNVAPTDEDIYDPRRWRRRTHASPPERAAVAALVDLGFVDLGAPDHAFTWWNYRTPVARDMGLRIDLALASPALAARVESVTVDRAARTVDRPSDHAPLVIDLDGRSD